MTELLNALANLSALRDRDEMDFALVELITRANHWHVSASRLLRAVGHLEDQRWLTRARLAERQASPECDRVWADWSGLPKRADHAHREAAVRTQAIVCAGAGPFITICPIDTQQPVCSLLEDESEEPLPTQSQEQIERILQIYRNLQGLLDYGEKDALTELLNRKTFDGAFLRAAVEQEGATDPAHPNRRVSHPQYSYWLAVIDIDHFKRVNDNFGHLIGDEVLLLMARQMRVNFRFHDQLYRFGGEEFVVLMRCADHADAAGALERFRSKVQGYPFPQVGTITVSVGFAALRPDDTPGGAFDRADKAVYHGKAHGRNQVCSYSELVGSGQLTEPAPEVNEADFF